MSKPAKVKKIIGRVLLAFVLVSIGFAIGKETTRNQMLAQTEAAPAATPGEDKVVVYYMHASLRCMTCTMIETMAEELIRTEFGGAVEAGRLEWNPVNYQDNNVLAERYQVGGNMIVLARFRDGKEIDARRLDRVMELANNRETFMAYVRDAIEDMLGTPS